MRSVDEEVFEDRCWGWCDDEGFVDAELLRTTLLPLREAGLEDAEAEGTKVLEG